MHCAEVPREDRGDAKTRSQLLAVLPLESFPDPTSPIQDEPCGHRALFLFLPSSRRGSVQVAYCRRQDARCSRQEKPIRPAEDGDSLSHVGGHDWRGETGQGGGAGRARHRTQADIERACKSRALLRSNM
ncbi:unnamed protein product [Prorocentrum cordatum]|uniref:Uncharacterized protein n=1 Tax=Prorocentrum cordatum TaxID=2364126 RepID=A0ABN9SVP0_9DINO|nr:unnamed protein product [Polarella glacialis]